MDFFAKSSAWLAQSLGVGAIDWVALARQGHPGVHDNAYIQQYMVPAFQRAAVTMSTLDLQPGTDAEVLADYNTVKDKLSSIANSILEVSGDAVRLNDPRFLPELAWKTINNVLHYLWVVSFTGFQAHLTGAIQRSGIDDKDVAYHASLVTMMMNLLAQLDKGGVLKPFKKDGMSGLGIAPALLVTLLVLGAVLIVALAWGAIAIYESSRINSRIDAACTKALQSGNAQDQAMCQQLQASSTPLANTVPNAVSGLVEKLSIVAMVGAGLYIMVQFGPGIATKVKQTFAAWKAA